MSCKCPRLCVSPDWAGDQRVCVQIRIAAGTGVGTLPPPGRGLPPGSSGPPGDVSDVTLRSPQVCLESVKHGGERTERAEVKEQPGDGPAGFQAEGKGQRVAPQAHPSDPTAPGPMSQAPTAHALTPGQGEGGRSPVPTPATCPPSGNGVRMRKLRSGTSRSQDKSSTSPQTVLALTVTA